MTTSTYEFIQAQVESGASRDQAIIALVSEHGVSLNQATKAYAAYAKDAGLTTALVSHKENALAFLRDEFPADEWDWRAVRDAVIELVERFDIAESTARDYTKAYSAELDVAHPVLDPRQAIFEWLRTHRPTATEKARFMEFACDELGRSKSNANEYWKGYELHLFLSE